MLRAAPIKGRGFTEADAQPGAPKVLLIAESIWNGQFRSDPDIIGRVVHANGEPGTIVGVMPASFGFPEHEAAWTPLTIGGGTDSKITLEVFGRLRAGVSMPAANAELAGVAASLAAIRPENRDRGLMAQGYIERKLPSRTRATFLTMLAAVFGVLLIACVNVANLQLARAADRTRDVAIRLALGAGRARLIRDLLVEALLLSAAGGLLGLAIARVGVGLVWRGVADPTVPFWIRFDIDVAVLAFTMLLTVFAAVASSLVPALRATRGGPNDTLKDQSRGATSLRVGRFSRALVVVQIALSFGLLMASGLVIKSIVNTALTPIPFRTDLLTGRIDLSAPAYKDDGAFRELVDRIRREVAGVPGVSAVTFAGGWPGVVLEYLEIDGQPVVEGRGGPLAEIISAAPEYIETIKLRVTSGRGLLPSDRAGAENAAVVTDDFAARYFPNGSPIGHRFRVRQTGASAAQWRTIVGTVEAVGNPARNQRETNAAIFVPLDQRPSRNLELIVAGAGPSAAPAGEIRKALARVNPSLVIDRFTTVQARYDERTWPVRVFGGLFSAFGIAAMLLASAGLYGVMAFAVRRRTSEIGIRMALGADRGRILRLIVRQGVTMLSIGIGLGAGLGFLLANQLTQLLFQVKPLDVPVIVVTFGVLAAAGLLASIMPARRAASIDPLIALRTE